jgi:hypothetical protein
MPNEINKKNSLAKFFFSPTHSKKKKLGKSLKMFFLFRAEKIIDKKLPKKFEVFFRFRILKKKLK